MGNASKSSARLALLQLAVMAAVVAAFIVDSMVDVGFGRRTDAQVDNIVSNAMPSVAYLSDARGRLRRIEAHLRRDVRAAEAHPGAAREGLNGIQQGFDTALASYLALPYFSGERDLYGEVKDTKAAFERATVDTLTAIDARDWKAAEASLADSAEARDRLEVALERVIVFNAAQGERLGQQVEAERSSIGARTLLVDGTLAVLAMSATVLAAIAWRRSVLALQERSSELDIFAGRVAHDVLSPLMVVQLGLDSVRVRLHGDASAQAVVDRSRRAVERVRNLVVGLLEFARAGASPATTDTAAVCEGIRGVLECVEADALDAHIDLVLESCPDRCVACPAGVLTSLTQNLVRNAIKHMGDAPRRQVRVCVRDAGPMLRVEVEDSGPGVPDEIRTTLFEPFVRGAGAASGVGLGLATVKKLAEAYRGCVGCQSTPGSGSVFWFALPRAPAAPARGVPLPAHSV
jgi:signal transduction histidine kinase